MSTDVLGASLLSLARNAIGHRFSLPTRPVTQLPEHRQPAATFVTLTQHGELRGCIGSLEAHRPLAEDVNENALAAAFRDPRFAPLRAEEFELTRIEVSLLTPATPLRFSDEGDALRQLQPDRDGIILQHGRRRATFLPQVWASLPTPELFLRQLKRKAGLPEDFWDSDLALFRYHVRKWKEA
ncbi:AmmeMemoRadiSam system protein A [uncultured Propionivibrio sp.]|uniref:AmmeMemoRadiSam system protein A n=1 Tax=uncultured Propionivibrio sp. TaxID=426737 RepID=UPI0029C0B0B2|nr:AmmeMemoRadiSam system protein A [uncultured Propionivibrio sp.]